MDLVFCVGLASCITRNWCCFPLCITFTSQQWLQTVLQGQLWRDIECYRGMQAAKCSGWVVISLIEIVWLFIAQLTKYVNSVWYCPQTLLACCPFSYWTLLMLVDPHINATSWLLVYLKRLLFCSICSVWYWQAVLVSCTRAMTFRMDPKTCRMPVNRWTIIPRQRFFRKKYCMWPVTV